ARRSAPPDRPLAAGADRGGGGALSGVRRGGTDRGGVLAAEAGDARAAGGGGPRCVRITRRSRLTMARAASEVGEATPSRSRRRRTASVGKKTVSHGWVGSAEQLYLVLQEAGDAITVVDMAGELRYAN